MITGEVITAGFKYFKLKNLKGRPDINSKEEYQEMSSMWAESLQDVNPDVFVAACKMLSDELTFYPSFAEVRKKCDDLIFGKKDVAAEVWEKYRKQMMAVHGIYSNNEDRESLFKSISCDVTKQACKIFDWLAYGQSDSSQRLFYAREFEKIYNSISEKSKFAKFADRALIGTGKTQVDLLNAPAEIKGLIKNLTKEIE